MWRQGPIRPTTYPCPHAPASLRHGLRRAAHNKDTQDTYAATPTAPRPPRLHTTDNCAQENVRESQPINLNQSNPQRATRAQEKPPPSATTRAAANPVTRRVAGFGGLERVAQALAFVTRSLLFVCTLFMEARVNLRKTTFCSPLPGKMLEVRRRVNPPASPRWLIFCILRVRFRGGLCFVRCARPLISLDDDNIITYRLGLSVGVCYVLHVFLKKGYCYCYGFKYR